MSNVSIVNYMNFFENPLITILLKNDCVLFGENVLSSLYYQYDLSNREIKCFAKY